MKKITLLCFIFLLGISVKSQVNFKPLQNFTNPALFNLNDSNCLNIGGSWIGEETEWLEDQVNIKGKYQMKLVLEQQGNKVSGTSFISFDEGTSNGTFKIRGLVLGNKLYFEEYEVQSKQFAQAGVTWCLRTGELDVVNTEQKLNLKGANYKGYAADYYFDCKAKVAMNLNGQVKIKTKNNSANEIRNDLNEQAEMRLYPNPADKLVNIVFKLNQEEQVRFDIYTLTGEFISNISNDKYLQGTHQVQFETANFIAGVYLVRMQTKHSNEAALLIISR